MQGLTSVRNPVSVSYTNGAHRVLHFSAAALFCKMYQLENESDKDWIDGQSLQKILWVNREQKHKETSQGN